MSQESVSADYAEDFGSDNFGDNSYWRTPTYKTSGGGTLTGSGYKMIAFNPDSTMNDGAAVITSGVRPIYVSDPGMGGAVDPGFGIMGNNSLSTLKGGSLDGTQLGDRGYTALDDAAVVPTLTSSATSASAMGTSPVLILVIIAAAFIFLRK